MGALWAYSGEQRITCWGQFFFYPAGSGEQTQILGLGSKPLTTEPSWGP